MRSASATLEVARTLGLRAAECVEHLRQSPLLQERKPDGTVVTNADKAADEIIRDGLLKAFPDHSILTEEGGLSGAANSDYLWLVDPIDGTRAFVAGRPGYSVMIGLLYRGEPIVGVVVDPLEGHLYEASKGEGCFYTFGKKRQRVHVSDRKELDHMPVISSTEFPKETETELKKRFPGPWITPVNSVGIKVGLMVRGLVDIYFNHRAVHVWDTCGPQIILEEAGGAMTYLNGDSLDYSLAGGSYRHRFQTLATNGSKHQQILKLLTPRRPGN